VLLSYFSQTLHLLEQDDSIYCISAWNDMVFTANSLHFMFLSFHMICANAQIWHVLTEL